MNKDINKAARKKSILSPFRIKKIMDILLDLSEPNSNAPCYTARMILDNDFEMVAEALSESMSFPDYNTVGLLELHRLKEETLSGNGNGFTDGFYDAWKFLEKHVDSRQSEIDELIEALGEMHKACSNIEEMNTHGNGKAALIRNYVQLWWPKASQLLEKYGKK